MAGQADVSFGRPTAVRCSDMVRTTLTVRTPGEGFFDMTHAVAAWLGEVSAEEGMLHLFCRHTSASLTIQENADPDVLHDLLSSLRKLAPQGAPYRHSVEGPDDMPAHIRTMLTASDLSVPVGGGGMMLGTWQGIYLVEHRSRPHSREIVASFVGRLADA